jgi:CRISPR-associated endonuclease Csn1
MRVDSAGKPVKGLTTQKSNPDWWAVRKPLHKDTVFAKVALRQIKEVRLGVALQDPDSIVGKELRDKIKELLALGYDEKRIKKYFSEGDNKDIWAEFNPAKVKVYYFTDDTFAVRKSPTIFASESPTKIEQKIKESVTDVSVQNIFLLHLKECDGDPAKAFSVEGVEMMNRNIVRLNGGKRHHPICKFRWYEHSKFKHELGRGLKSSKYVEAADGTNLYFAVYTNGDGARKFDTIPLNEVIDRMKNGLTPVPEKNAAGDKLLFYLSPNDLVYVPSEEEIKTEKIREQLFVDRIYKMVSSSGSQCPFIAHRVAKSIVDKLEFTRHNKMERAVSGEMIKEICIPLKVDRLGNITYIGTEFLPKRK